MATKTLPALAVATQAQAEADSARLAARDNRDTRIAQLSALTAALSGEGNESFRNCSDRVQSGVMWLLCDLAREVEVANDIAEGYSEEAAND